MLTASAIRSFLRASPIRTAQRLVLSQTLRFASPISKTSPISSFLRHNCTKSTIGNKNTAQVKIDKPELMLAFKCKKCHTRSSHIISKQAYSKGTVLVTCPGCKNRHLIADHLKIFSDERINIQDILEAKGESVSQSTDDLVFDEIPERLKNLIGRHAKDAPTKKEDQTNESPRYISNEKTGTENS